MGLFGRRNETSTWLEGSSPPTLDLDALRLGNVAVGDPADGLSVLGPGEFGTASGEYRFPAHGVGLKLHRGRVEWFEVYLRPDGDMLAFRGTVRHGGGLIELTTAASVARFCEPEVVDHTDDGRVLTYYADGAEWEVTLAVDGRPAVVSVYGRRGDGVSD